MAGRSPIHELETGDRRGRWFVALATLLSIALLASTWVGLFSFLSVSAAYGTFTDLQREYIPETEGMTLNLPDLSRTSRMHAQDGTLLAELHDGRNSEPVSIDEVPEQVIEAILAAEDADFYEHEGIHFQSIAQAAVENLLEVSTRGGSTITQQVVKNNFVGDERSIQRKITEAFVAAELERRYTKDQILEFYLNSVYFGSSAYGINTAAGEFFGKDLAQLNIAEAATLAVLIRNPSYYDPRRRPEFTLQRRDQVIDQMVEEGFITEEQGERNQRQPLEVIPHQTFQGPADHVVAEAKRQLLNSPEFAFLGTTKEIRKQRIFGCAADDTTCQGGGGLRIEVTIDLDLQLEANRILQSWLPVIDPADLSSEEMAACRERYETAGLPVPETVRLSCLPAGAISTVDNRTGAVLVMASGLTFDQTQFDLAIQGRRNPGSAFKPFGLVAALESGITLASYWDGRSPKEIECPQYCTPPEWLVHNAAGSTGLTSLDTATSSSINVVFAQVAVAVGPDAISEVAHRMGITSDLGSAEHAPSLVLGAGAVTTLEMASAFSTFATNGLHAKPYLISRIVAGDGEVIYEHQPEVAQVVDPAVIAAARQPLTRVPTGGGTAPRANIDRPQGGKTGTHQTYQDAWYVGFVPQYSTAVWVGFKDFQLSLRNVTINGETYSRVFGGTVPAPIWAEFMAYMLQGVPGAEFPDDPQGTSAYFRPAETTVPSVVGMDEGEAINELYDAHLNVSVEEVGSLEPEGTVVGQSIEPGAEVNQGTTVAIQVASGEPPSAPLLDLVGQTLDQALASISEFEEETEVFLDYKIQYVKVDDPSQDDVVLSTDPPPGSEVVHGQSVELRVGEFEEQGEGKGPPGGDD